MFRIVISKNAFIRLKFLILIPIFHALDSDFNIYHFRKI